MSNFFPIALTSVVVLALFPMFLFSALAWIILAKVANSESVNLTPMFDVKFKEFKDLDI
jgi:hypothetical protein